MKHEVSLALESEIPCFFNGEYVEFVVEDSVLNTNDWMYVACFWYSEGVVEIDTVNEVRVRSKSHKGFFTHDVLIGGNTSRLKTVDVGWDIYDRKSMKRYGARNGHKPRTWKTERHLANRSV